MSAQQAAERDGATRLLAGMRMEYRAGLGIIPADYAGWEEQRPRFRTWADAEEWAWTLTSESEAAK